MTSEVLRASGGALHGDQLIQRQDQAIDVENMHRRRIGAEVLKASSTGDFTEKIDAAKAGGKSEVVPAERCRYPHEKAGREVHREDMDRAASGPPQLS